MVEELKPNKTYKWLNLNNIGKGVVIFTVINVNGDIRIEQGTTHTSYQGVGVIMKNFCIVFISAGVLHEIVPVIKLSKYEI